MRLDAEEDRAQGQAEEEAEVLFLEERAADELRGLKGPRGPDQREG